MDGNARKPKKPLYKRWWFIVIIGFIALGAIGGTLGSDNERDVTVSGKQQPIAQKDTKKEDHKEVLDQTNKQENIPREYKNALRAAQNYLSTMPFSEKGLYDQLVSEYGDKYPAAAAQYAIKNVKVDYNVQALKAAKNYLDIMPMSDQELFNQLVSGHGDKYTKEQAQYAIDNLPD